MTKLKIKLLIDNSVSEIHENIIFLCILYILDLTFIQIVKITGRLCSEY